MPWIIASQTIPILAIAPIVIVVLGSLGLKGLVPKALISAYLCFFPVTIGMVKGLTSPEPMQLDLMRTYSASRWQTFWKLRWPASVPFLFASLKVAIAISLVGAIVGELPTGAQAGLGARLLTGSYYGQTVQIWAALFAASILAAAMVALTGLAERLTLGAMGLPPMSAAALAAPAEAETLGRGQSVMWVLAGALMGLSLVFDQAPSVDGAAREFPAPGGDPGCGLPRHRRGRPPRSAPHPADRGACRARLRRRPDRGAPPGIAGAAGPGFWLQVLACGSRPGSRSTRWPRSSCWTRPPARARPRGPGRVRRLGPVPVGGRDRRLRRAGRADAQPLGDRRRASPRSTAILWADFVQTFLKAVLAGWAIGCAAGFLVAILADRVPFLRRGLLPLGNLVAALPIIGIAPDHGDVVRLRLAVEGRRGRRHDLLPDAGEHRGRPRRRRARSSAT